MTNFKRKCPACGSILHNKRKSCPDCAYSFVKGEYQQPKTTQETKQISPQKRLKVFVTADEFHKLFIERLRVKPEDLTVIIKG